MRRYWAKEDRVYYETLHNDDRVCDDPGAKGDSVYDEKGATEENKRHKRFLLGWGVWNPMHDEAATLYFFAIRTGQLAPSAKLPWACTP